MRTTLKVIAEKTGMSVTAVSLVLNHKDCRIAENKKRLILETADELQYRPNLVAVSLVKGTTHTVGLIISDIRNDFFSSLAKAAEEECRKHQWNLILCNSNSHEEDVENIRMLADKGVNGIIFGMATDTTEKMAAENLALLKKEKLPFVQVDRYVEAGAGDIVCVNHVKGGFDATEHLISLGHRRIACITGPEHLVDSQKRLEGYRKALQAGGIEEDPALIIPGKYSFDSGTLAIRQLIRQGSRFTAVFAFNDVMAIAAIRELTQQGFRIPEDISIVGYDDIFMSEFLSIPLTTIHQPTYDLGAAAAELVMTREKRPHAAGEKRVLDPALVIRGSTRQCGQQ